MRVAASIHGVEIVQPVSIAGNEPLQISHHVFLQLRFALVHVNARSGMRGRYRQKPVPDPGRFQPVADLSCHVEDLDRFDGLELDPRS